MYILSKYKPSIFAFLTNGTSKGYLLSFSLFFLTAGLITLSQIIVGVPLMTGRPWDVPIILDGAWRILNGQIPHNDFYSFLGAFPLYSTALGMFLEHQPSVYSIVLGNIIIMSVLTITAFYLFWQRISAINSYVFAVFLLFLVVTPRPLGDPYFLIDYAMRYNRFGEAVVILFSIGIIFQRKLNIENRWVRYGDIVILGILFILLLFIKINYYVVALVIIVTSILLRLHTLWMYIGLAGSSLVALLLILYSTGISFSTMINDIIIVASAQSVTGKVWKLYINFINHMQYFFLLLLLCIEISMDNVRYLNKHRLYEVLVLVIVFSCCALFLLSTNSQREELPLLSVAALYCFERVRIKRCSSYPNDSEFYRYLLLFFIMLLYLMPTLGRDMYAMRSYHFSAVYKYVREFRKPLPVLEKTNLHNFYLSSHDWVRRADMESYKQELKEGIELIRKNITKDMKLRVISFSDPYTFALGLKPFDGGAICLDYNFIKQKSHPPLSRIINSATHIFISKKEYHEILEGIFANEMSQYNFENISESEHFNIYKISNSYNN